MDTDRAILGLTVFVIAGVLAVIAYPFAFLSLKTQLKIGLFLTCLAITNGAIVYIIGAWDLLIGAIYLRGISSFMAVLDNANSSIRPCGLLTFPVCSDAPSTLSYYVLS